MVNHRGEPNSLSRDADSNDSIIKTSMVNVFSNIDNKDKIYPVTVFGVTANQHLDKTLKTFFSKEDWKGRITCRVLNDVDIIVYDDKRM